MDIILLILLNFVYILLHQTNVSCLPALNDRQYSAPGTVVLKSALKSQGTFPKEH